MNSSKNNRILAVLPHPDDIEILCAGTLMRLTALGCEVHLAVMTAGDKGSDKLSRSEIAAVRREEARRGAAEIGAASLRILEFQDLEIVFDNSSRRRITELVRSVDPGLTITTPPFDYMFDHIITSQLVRDALFNAGCKNYDVGGEPLGRIPYLYYTEAIGGLDMFGKATPISCRVDISSLIDRKACALARHESQRSWLRRQHGTDDYIEAMRRSASLQGAVIGVGYAEAFIQHVGHPYPKDDLLSRLLDVESAQQGARKGLEHEIIE